jgi:hypothetical protein
MCHELYSFGPLDENPFNLKYRVQISNFEGSVVLLGMNATSTQSHKEQTSTAIARLHDSNTQRISKPQPHLIFLKVVRRIYR